MHLQSNMCWAVLLLLTAVAAKYHRLETTSIEVGLQSLKTSTFDSLEAVYTSGNLTFHLTSRAQSKAPSSSWTDPGSASYIVSTISVIEMDKQEQPETLSQLVIPGNYLFERKIPDMEKRIVHSAKDMMDAMQRKTSTLAELANLAYLYEVMVNDLVQRIKVPSKFNQGRASIIYHVSVAKAAQRLAGGARTDEVCPAHQAYQHQGLFACQQEYLHHAKRVLATPHLECNDPACERQRSIARYIEREIRGLDPEQVADVVEDILSLGNNSKLAEDIARLIACGNITCMEPGCDSWLDTEGWFIYGADWGCCGDYPGCCYLATQVCLIHDAICTCCSFPTFCLDPFCDPDPWCSNMTTTALP